MEKKSLIRQLLLLAWLPCSELLFIEPDYSNEMFSPTLIKIEMRSKRECLNSNSNLPDKKENGEKSLGKNSTLGKHENSSSERKRRARNCFIWRPSLSNLRRTEEEEVRREPSKTFHVSFREKPKEEWADGADIKDDRKEDTEMADDLGMEQGEMDRGRGKRWRHGVRKWSRKPQNKHTRSIVVRVPVSMKEVPVMVVRDHAVQDISFSFVDMLEESSTEQPPPNIPEPREKKDWGEGMPASAVPVKSFMVSPALLQRLYHPQEAGPCRQSRPDHKVFSGVLSPYDYEMQ